MGTFFINRNSTLPRLTMSFVKTGQDNLQKLGEYIESGCEAYFTMTNIDTGRIKIAHQKAYIVQIGDETCAYDFDIVYQWRPQDTNEPGRYEGKFILEFDDGQILDVPILEPLTIYVNEGRIKK